MTQPKPVKRDQWYHFVHDVLMPPFLLLCGICVYVALVTFLVFTMAV